LNLSGLRVTRKAWSPATRICSSAVVVRPFARSQSAVVDRRLLPLAALGQISFALRLIHHQHARRPADHHRSNIRPCDQHVIDDVARQQQRRIVHLLGRHDRDAEGVRISDGRSIMRNMVRLARPVLVVAAIAVLTANVFTLAAQTQTGARIVEINGNYRNGTATFRIEAPQARDVRVVMEPMNAADAKPMVKDDKGMWTASLGPFEPDYYAVAFLTDGVWRTAGYVHITGSTPQAWDPRPVPHGTVHQHWYNSKTLGMFRSVVVYTPPGYEEAKESYPVLYLLHGSGGDEGSWVNDGLANIILDNQIADGRAKPMIVVMPFGHTNASPRAGVVPSYAGRDTPAFTEELLKEVMPTVERTYRVRRGADARGIAGFSMGGNHARLIGLQRMDLFHSVATFSGTVGVRGPQVTAEAIEEAYGPVFADPDGTNAALRLLWLGVGSEETRLLSQHKLFTNLLDERRITHTYVVEPGGHTWHVWRRNLRDLVALLFR